MKSFLAIQAELNKTRDDINRKQGRLRLLANLTDLTTVTVSIQERRKFEPEKSPETVETVGFGTKAGRTFRESGETLMDLGQGVALFLVALVPWLPFLAVVGLPIAWAIRKSRAAAAKTPSPTTPAA